MSEEKIKDLQERKKQINTKIKEVRRTLSEYDGEVEFPLIYSFRVRGQFRRHKKLVSFKQHKLPYTTMSFGLGKDMKVSGLGYGICVYLGNKLKPKSRSYLVEIKITPLEEEAEGQ